MGNKNEISTVEKMKLVGKNAQIKLGSMVFDVTVIDYKFTYGKDRWCVQPKAGVGTAWVENIIL